VTGEPESLPGEEVVQSRTPWSTATIAWAAARWASTDSGSWNREVASTRREGEVVDSVSVPEIQDLLLAGRRILGQIAGP
jgi:hypothetical protein